MLMELFVSVFKLRNLNIGTVNVTEVISARTASGGASSKAPTGCEPRLRPASDALCCIPMQHLCGPINHIFVANQVSVAENRLKPRVMGQTIWPKP